MKTNLKKKAVQNAIVLAKQFGLDEHFLRHIMDGQLHYSLALCPQNTGICVEINREGTGQFSELVRMFEENTSAYVYHCILTGPFLTLLFTNEENEETTLSGQDEIYAAVLDIDLHELSFVNVRLARCGDALVRID